MRKTGATLAAFALAVTLGACGSDNAGGNNGGGGAATENNGGGGNGGAVAAASIADLAKSIEEKTGQTDTAHFALTADAGGQQMTGEGDLRFAADNAAMSMTMSTPDGDIETVLVDNIFYVKLPQEIEPGKPWIKIDPNDDSPMASALGGMTEQMSKNADPRAALAQFQESGEITDSKEEDLDGQKTTHYTITVDVQKLADNQEDPTMKQAMEQAIAGGLKDFPVEIWINEDDLPVRFSMDMPMGDPTGSGQSATMKMQMDYTKWGEPVDITAPAAEEIAEMPGS